MRTEISQAKKEANFYLQNVEKGKAIDAMETRKRKRADQVMLWCSCTVHCVYHNSLREQNCHVKTTVLHISQMFVLLPPEVLSRG